MKTNSLTPEGTTSHCNLEDLKWQVSLFAVFGGFIYFNEEMHVVGVIVVTPFEGPYKIKLAGPFKTPIKVIKDMNALGRLGIIPLEVSHEAGCVAKVSFIGLIGLGRRLHSE